MACLFMIHLTGSISSERGNRSNEYHQENGSVDELGGMAVCEESALLLRHQLGSSGNRYCERLETAIHGRSRCGRVYSHLFGSDPKDGAVFVRGGSERLRFLL